MNPASANKTAATFADAGAHHLLAGIKLSTFDAAKHLLAGSQAAYNDELAKIAACGRD